MKKIMLCAVAIVAGHLAVGCGGKPHDPSHAMNVRCQAVQCSNGAWVSHMRVLNSDTASTPREADYFTCDWDNGDELQAVSYDGACLVAP